MIVEKFFMELEEIEEEYRHNIIYKDKSLIVVCKCNIDVTTYIFYTNIAITTYSKYCELLDYGGLFNDPHNYKENKVIMAIIERIKEQE